MPPSPSKRSIRYFPAITSPATGSAIRTPSLQEYTDRGLIVDEAVASNATRIAHEDTHCRDLESPQPPARKNSQDYLDRFAIRSANNIKCRKGRLRVSQGFFVMSTQWSRIRRCSRMHRERQAREKAGATFPLGAALFSRPQSKSRCRGAPGCTVSGRTRRW